MSERSGTGWKGYIGGQAPVQGWGRVDGYPWYFRARGDSWSMEIVDDKNVAPELLPLIGPDVSGWLIEADWGIYPAASFMPEDTAWDLIMDVVEKFRAKQLPYLDGNTGVEV